MKRVKAVMFTTYNERSDEYTDTVYQYLQEKITVKLFNISLFSYWKTIDSEIVPTYAWMQRNTLGSTDWKSKFYRLDVEFINP